MKKIMFNDKYGLTQAVLNGRKTQTRRIAYMPNGFLTFDDKDFQLKKTRQWTGSAYALQQ